MKFEWEEIYNSEEARKSLDNAYESTYRSKVIGGWLIRHEIMVDADRENEFDGWTNLQNTMIFLHDPDHKWEIEDER